MDGLERDTKMLQDLVKHVGEAPAAIAKRAGIATSTLYRPLNGTAETRLSQRTLEKLRAAYPAFPGWEGDADDAGPRRHIAYVDQGEPGQSTSDTLAIPMLDLAYGMGGTYLDSIEVEETIEHFPRAFVRRFTKAPPGRLYFAYGIGDSMMPTIHDSDMLLIDTSKDAMRMNDRVWALVEGDIGMVKRLRAHNGQLEIISDNDAVPNYTVDPDDVRIIGQVVARIGRL
ncbi:MAG: hypothetical protein COW16_10565 [Sphingomonadales bacterium CG12_big_fil_rev_8_21_14_0_65_65_10]|nr:MAG: hypothetical protein COW16_10565 [Sphingomonadales bacterium CG12_big_fil_rev_8_21_14_0_65_65_10]